MDPNNTELQNIQIPQQAPRINKKLILLICGGFLLLALLIISATFSSNSSTALPNTAATPTPVNSGIQTTSGENILSTDPVNGAKRADYTGDIHVVFKNAVFIDTINFTLSPSTPGKTSQVDPHTISFKPSNQLQKNTNYEVTVIWKENNQQFSYKWQFTTDKPSGEESFTPSDIAAFEKTRAAAEKAYQERKAQFPFLTKLPYISLHFRIDINSSNTIIITDYGQTPNEVKQFQQEARDWLQTNGGNLSTLRINYISAY